MERGFERRSKITLVILAAVLALAITVSVAWITLSHKKIADVTSIGVDDPPTISVLNNETTTIDILNLDGLQIGRQKCLVFCVTPSSEGLVNKFVLQLAYTTNLWEKIDLYTCEYIGTSVPTDGSINADETGALLEPRDPQAGDFVSCPAKDGSLTTYYYRVTSGLLANTVSTGKGYSSAELADSVEPENVGVYKLYKDVQGELSPRFQFEDRAWTDNWTNKGQYLFYMLYIHWDEDELPEGALDNLAEKETDIVYVSAKGIMDY